MIRVIFHVTRMTFLININTMVSVEKDKKGSCMIVSHLRCGYHESIWLSTDELKELRDKLNNMQL